MSFAISAAAVVVGCSAAPTRIVVVTDSDIAVPSSLDAISFEIDASEIGGVSSTRAIDLAASGVAGLPVTFGILHEGGALGPITVRAIGLDDGGAIVMRSARLSFVAHRTVELRLDLTRTCEGRECESDESCRGGECASPDVDSSSLPDWMPGGGQSITDAGPPAAPDAEYSCPSPCECGETCSRRGCRCED